MKTKSLHEKELSLHGLSTSEGLSCSPNPEAISYHSQYRSCQDAYPALVHAAILCIESKYEIRLQAVTPSGGLHQSFHNKQ